MKTESSTLLENKVIPIGHIKKEVYSSDSTSIPKFNFDRYIIKDYGYNKDELSDINNLGGGNLNEKEYVDLKINALEKNMNQKFEAQEAIFVEKLNHLETKIDGQHTLIISKIDGLSDTIKRDIEIISKSKVDELQESLTKKQEQSKNHLWMVIGVYFGAATLIFSIIQFFIQNFMLNK